MIAPFRHLRPRALLLAAAAVPAHSAAAQAPGRHQFVVDSAQSQFTISGTLQSSPLSFPITFTPSTFSPTGTADADLTIAAGALQSGRLLAAGSVLELPTLTGSTFLGPLQITGARLALVSVDPAATPPDSFAIGAGGSFSTSIAFELLGGTASFLTTSLPLIGQTTPTPATGTVTATPTGMHLTAQVGATVVAGSSSGTVTVHVNGTVVADGADFAADVDSISLATGGTQIQTLSAGTQYAGAQYLVLATVSGTTPGITLPGLHVPLNPDQILAQSFLAPNLFPWINSAGTLDALGTAQSAVALPPLPIPGWVSVPAHHAWLVIQGGNIVTASRAIVVHLDP